MHVASGPERLYCKLHMHRCAPNIIYAPIYDTTIRIKASIATTIPQQSHVLYTYGYKQHDNTVVCAQLLCPLLILPAHTLACQRFQFHFPSCICTGP